MRKNTNPLLSIPSLYLTILFVFIINLYSIKPAQAEGFALYEWSARGLALGGSMQAMKPDASVIAYNPAQMTQLKGTQIMSGLSAVVPRGKVTVTDSEKGTTATHARAKTWLVPHFYITHQLNERLTFGFGQFSRFGLGFEYDHNWAGRFNIYGVELQTLSWNPSLALKVTDSFSIGAGIEMVYVDLDIKKRSKVSMHSDPKNPSNANYLGTMELDSNIHKADDLGYGFNLGVHYKLNDQWAAGLSYRSQVSVKAFGDMRYTNKGILGTNPNLGPYQDAAAKAGSKAYMDKAFKDGKAHSTVHLPASISGGIAWSPTDDLRMEAGATWTRWSSFRELKIHVPNGLPPADSKKDWGDSWRLNVGAEYDLVDWLSIRGGYVYDRSPMTEQYEDYLVPTSSRHIYTVGVGLHFDSYDIDLTYGYLQINGRTYKENKDLGVLKSHTRGADSHIGSVSFAYKF